MIYRIYFDVGYEDFRTEEDLLIKYPKAEAVLKNAEESRNWIDTIFGKVMDSPKKRRVLEYC